MLRWKKDFLRIFSKSTTQTSTFLPWKIVGRCIGFSVGNEIHRILSGISSKASKLIMHDSPHQLPRIPK